jgi:uncharacterized membrane protein YdjX (TVP38/TMEM64 family)
MRAWLPLLVFIGALIALLMVGRFLAYYFGIELTLDSVHDFRDWIDSIGWWGPLAYVVLVVIRLFLGLSTHVVLTLGGVAFGLTEAIIWGGVGLTLSGVVQYGLGYYLGSDWVTKRLGDKNERLQRILSRSGVPALFLITVHPLGPQSPMTIVAGAVRFQFAKFVMTMMVASPIRASIYAVLGGAVLEFDLWFIAQITVGCIVLMVLPFLHRKTRRLLLGLDS